MAQTKEMTKDEYDDYGRSDDVKFQTKWLPEECTVCQLFIHLRETMEVYLPRAYTVNRLQCIDTCAKLTFIAGHVAHDNCPDGLRRDICKMVGFVTGISYTRRTNQT